MRPLNFLAKLFLILAVASGVPLSHALPHSNRPSLQTIHEHRVPVEAVASREGARTNIAAASRSVHPHDAVAPAGTLLPALRILGVVTRASDALAPPVSLSSSLVRGPPLAL